MMENITDLNQLQEQVRNFVKVTDVIHFFKQYRFVYRGMTSGLAVSVDKNKKVITHPIRLKAQYMNIYLNLNTKSYMVEPLLKERL